MVFKAVVKSPWPTYRIGLNRASLPSGFCPRILCCKVGVWQWGFLGWGLEGPFCPFLYSDTCPEGTPQRAPAAQMLLFFSFRRISLPQCSWVLCSAGVQGKKSELRWCEGLASVPSPLSRIILHCPKVISARGTFWQWYKVKSKPRPRTGWTVGATAGEGGQTALGVRALSWSFLLLTTFGLLSFLTPWIAFKSQDFSWWFSLWGKSC